MEPIEPIAYRILEYIRRINREEGRGPSAREIAQHFELPDPVAAMPYLQQLSRRKMIRLHPAEQEADRREESAR